MRYFDTPTGYRAGNYCPPKHATALDILQHEVNELGNEDFGSDFEQSGLTKEQLHLLSATDVVWVCKTKSAAAQYTSDRRLRCYEVHGLEGSVVICGNNDDGYLVLQPSGMIKLGLQPVKKTFIPDMPRPRF